MATLALSTAHGVGRRNIVVIARKEIADAFRNRLVVIALIMLLSLALVAVGLGAVQVRARVTEYDQSVQILRDLGRTEIPPMPDLNPLAVSKNFVNYLAMVGALLAIILGNRTIVKERTAGTLQLILSRPVYRDQFLTGKVIGNAALLAGMLVVVGLVTIGAVGVIGGVWLTLDQVIKLMLTMVMSWLYMLIYFLLALLLTLLLPKGNQALLVTVIVWLVFAFIFPQIGDTMDLDNQLPGGFFAAIGIGHDQEQQTLTDFRWYESVRDGVEELSPTKHYERISFALLGVKPQFATNTWTEVVTLKANNIIGLLVPVILLAGASYVVFLRRDL